MPVEALPPPARAVLGALCALVVAGPAVDPAGRLAGLAGLVAALAAGRRSRRVLLAGALLGCTGAARLQLALPALEPWWGYEGPVLVGRAGRLLRPGAPAIAARGLEAVAGDTLRVRVQDRPRWRNPDDGNPWRRLVGQGARPWARARDEPAPDEAPGRLAGSDGLWRALLTGERDGLAAAAREAFARIGMAHLLALSGLHVGLVAGALLPWLRRRPPRDALRWLAPPLLLWLGVVGPSPSFLRAVAMVLLLASARAIGRPADAAAALATVALLELAIRPAVATSVGWQLSYAATSALVGALRGLARWPRAALLVAPTLLAQAATLPWMVSTFGRLPWATVALQLVVGPAFALLMGTGMLLLAVGAIVPPLAPGATAAVQLLSHAFGALLALVVHHAPPPLGHPGLHGLAWALALLAALPWWWPSAGAIRARLGWTTLLLVLAHLPLLAPRPMQWWSLDVGQGDAGVLRDGRRWLVVDAGPRTPVRDEGARVVLPFLARRNATGVDLLLTHGHLDHTGGAPVMLASGRVARLLVAATDSGEAWVDELLVAAAPGVELRWLAAGDTLRGAGGPTTILWPRRVASGWHRNDRSLVFALGPPGRRLLLTGDLERAGEAATLQEGTVPAAAVLKVAHHGGDTGSDPPWLGRVGARWAILSCGVRNRHGHPHPAVLERLGAAGARPLRTDLGGAVGIVWDGVEGLQLRRPGSP